MATIEYWIQLENRPWNASPHNIDRITGMDMKAATGKDPVDVTLTSPGTGVTKTRKMFNPLRDSNGNVKDALILRCYKPPTQLDQSDAWTMPDDRKVNPWDLNERWAIPGPQGNTPGAIQISAQVQAVSQFEDTRIFGTMTYRCNIHTNMTGTIQVT